MNVSIIIPNYNGKRLLEKNFPQVLVVIADEQKTHDGKVEVIVIDDGSTDDSRQILKDMQEKARESGVTMRVLANVRNMGFSPTVNKGVEYANGEVVVLLNTDVLPQKGFLKPLLRHFDDKSIFAVGCVDESVERDKIVLRGRGVGKWKRGFLMHARGEVDKADTLWVSGGSGAFQKSIWEKLGGLCELYAPFYWEDIDLSYRAQKAGYKVLFERESVVRHLHEEGAIKKTATQEKITTIAYRNQIYFVWLNITDKMLLTLHLLWMMFYVLQAFIRGDWPFIKAYVMAISRLQDVLMYRKKYTRLFTLSDKEVLSRYSITG